jgi:diguanylate cyclase (GGDEF)-like protein
MTIEKSGDVPSSEFAEAKRKWHEALDKAIAKAAETGGPISVILADINNLKWLNDTVGHHAGDTGIEYARTSMVANSVSSCRIGGDEFAGFLFVSEEEALKAAESIRASFRSAINYPGNEELVEAGLGLAIGISTSSPDSNSSELLRKADYAMYEDKLRQQEFTQEEIEVFERIQQSIAEQLLDLGYEHRIRDFGRYIVQQTRKRRS